MKSLNVLRVGLGILFGLIYAQNASAVVGMPMMYEIRPETSASKVLAGLVEKSLQRDPSGNSVIAGSPGTTPNHFLEALRRYHPGSMVTKVGDLPDFFGSLLFRTAPSGTYRMSRMLCESGRCTLDPKGWDRAFDSGEGAWKDPNTGLFVLAGDCSNVVHDPPRTTVVPRLTSPPGQSAPPLVTSGGPCPEGSRRFLVHFWGEELLRPDLLAQARALTAQERDFTNSALSRTVGADLRTCEKAGQCNHAPGDYALRVSWIREGADHSILEEKDEYITEGIASNGLFSKEYPSALMYSDLIIRVVFHKQYPDGRILTGPKRSPRTGREVIRVYPSERHKSKDGKEVCRHHSHALLGSGMPSSLSTSTNQ